MDFCYFVAKYHNTRYQAFLTDSGHPDWLSRYNCIIRGNVTHKDWYWDPARLCGAIVTQFRNSPDI